MTALAALLERPLWELALGTTSLVAASAIGALVYFWIGFRIAEVSALLGFEGMFSGQDAADAGSARAIPAEVAARLQAIQDRRRMYEEQSSLDELAAAMSAPKLPLPRKQAERQESKVGRVDREL
jgi:hypothetical protein